MSTKNRFEWMKKIWKGAKWSNFVKRSLLESRSKMIKKWKNARRNIREKVQKFMGYRKPGAKEEKYIPEDAKKVELKSLKSLNKDGIDNFNIWTIGQGRTTQCVPHQVAFAMSSLATRTFQKIITFDPQRVKDLMVKRGWYTEGEGAYIHHGLKAVVQECKKVGYVKDISRDKYYFEEYDFVPKEDWDQTIDKGYWIVTGALVGNPMCTPSWYFRVVDPKEEAVFGHCVGQFDDYTKKYKTNTSWEHYGIKRNKIWTGNFWTSKAHKNHFFRGWIFPSVKKV